MKKPKTRRKSKAEPFVNLFAGFQFHGRLKDTGGMESGKFEPKLHPPVECDHVKSSEWWWDEDKLLTER